MATVGQVLGATTRAPGPRLQIGTPEGVQSIALDGAGTLEVTGEATCIGSFEDGWTPCPRQAMVGRMAQCSNCCPLDDPECVFAPKCAAKPEACTCLTSFDVPHVVYIAWYGILPKVGLTQERRVAARLQEQGADAWFLAGKAMSRGAARNLEREISALHHIPEWRKTREKLAHLQRPVPWEQVEERAATLAAQLSKHYDVDRTLHRVADHVTDQLPARPHEEDALGIHRGRWIGGKGAFAFYEAPSEPGRLDFGVPRIVAVKLTGLVGHHVAWQPAADQAP